MLGIAPGPVNTPMWLGPGGVADVLAGRAGRDRDDVLVEARSGVPLGRFTEPDEVANLVTYLVSDRAATITGTTVLIDGGLDPTSP